MIQKQGPDRVEEYVGKLSSFFPPSDPESPWMLRLMIIRDDLNFELNGLKLHPNDGIEEVWRSTYFIRRISVTLLEAANILGHEAGRVAKNPTDDVIRALAEQLQKANAFLNERREVLEAIRHTIGAHVRPGNADAEVAVEKKVLEQHPNLAGRVNVSFGRAHGSSYRDLTKLSLAFAWPHADDDASVERAHDELASAILEGAALVLQMIDALLFRHWWKHGIIAAHEGETLGVLDHRTGHYAPLGAPPKSTRAE